MSSAIHTYRPPLQRPKHSEQQRGSELTGPNPENAKNSSAPVETVPALPNVFMPLPGETPVLPNVSQPETTEKPAAATTSKTAPATSAQPAPATTLKPAPATTSKTAPATSVQPAPATSAQPSLQSRPSTTATTPSKHSSGAHHSFNYWGSNGTLYRTVKC